MFSFDTVSIQDRELALFIAEYEKTGGVPVFFSDGKYLLCKGFCDVHVHFREPGFSYKETIRSGSLAAAHGGYTCVCTMPNLNPAPDTAENVKKQTDIIKRDAVIDVIPYGRITKEGQNGIADMEEMKDFVCAFSDDGKGVQDGETMERAMRKAKSLGKIIVAHCEDNTLLKGGCVHEGRWAERNGFVGISSASEYKQVERDIDLVRKTGVKYHVCHVSTKESVAFIAKAKSEGLDITCETAPHYLVLCEDDLQDEGRFKMNPPLRSKEDREALINGIKDGTIDIVATDHAPHSPEEKSKGLAGSAFGIVGLETSFSVLYTHLVRKNVVSLEQVVRCLTDNPRERFGLKDNGFTVFDLSRKYRIDSKDFMSQGKSTPFEGNEVYGKCVLTVCDGKIVYRDSQYIK